MTDAVFITYCFKKIEALIGVVLLSVFVYINTRISPSIDRIGFFLIDYQTQQIQSTLRSEESVSARAVYNLNNRYTIFLFVSITHNSV